MKVAVFQASGQAFWGSLRYRRGRVHFSSAFKPNHDAEPVLKSRCQVHLASVSVQISTLAVKHSPHYLPDIDSTFSRRQTFPEFYKKTNRPSLTNH